MRVGVGVCYCCCFSTEGWWRKEEYFSCCNLGWTINTSEKRTISQRKGGKIQIFRNINLCRIWWSANLLQTKIAYKGLLNQKLRYAKNRFNLKYKLWTITDSTTKNTSPFIIDIESTILSGKIIFKSHFDGSLWFSDLLKYKKQRQNFCVHEERLSVT